jgi:hypothetical protein
MRTSREREGGFLRERPDTETLRQGGTTSSKNPAEAKGRRKKNQQEKGPPMTDIVQGHLDLTKSIMEGG